MVVQFKKLFNLVNPAYSVKLLSLCSFCTFMFDKVFSVCR